MIMEGWQHDTQLLTWVLSYDGTTVPDPLAICGAAAALAISDIPLTKPVAAVELGMNPTTGAFIVNPTRVEQSVSPLHMTLAGTREGVLMIEGFSDFLTEAQMVAAVEVAHAAVARICVAIESWAKMVGKAKKLDGLKVVPKELRDALYEELGDKVFSMLRLTDPEVGGKDTSAGRAEMDALTSAALARFTEPYGATAVQVAFKKLCGTKMRELIRDTGRRCDGRAIDQVRPISIDHGLLPHTHGSALFTRGATQAIATATLGTSGMRLKLEDLDGEVSKRFYLQYTFPPSCVGEVGRVGAPGRREIGHGNLAERALLSSIPSEAVFPYSMRVESLITESSGSSSMASVCGGCLAMMDAGVPLTRMVAGVAMGLILDEDAADPAQGDAPIVLTDILGLEDGLGTMDFKVAGDATGISAFQLDIKCEGLSIETMAMALEQARKGRLHILDCMQAAMPNGPRASVPATVPKLLAMMVPQSSIGKLIGPGGKTIRMLIDEFALSDLDIEETGTEGRVTMSGYDDAKLAACKAKIEGMVGELAPRRPTFEGPLPEAGRVFRKLQVVSVKAFGVFVALGDEFPGLEGLIHISELHTDRIRNIEGFIKPGHLLDVKVIGQSDDGKLKLSRKAVLELDATASSA